MTGWLASGLWGALRGRASALLLSPTTVSSVALLARPPVATVSWRAVGTRVSAMPALVLALGALASRRSGTSLASSFLLSLMPGVTLPLGLSVSLLVTPCPTVTPSLSMLPPTLPVAIRSVAVIVGVAFVRGMVSTVTVGSALLVLVSSGPTLVVSPAVVVKSFLVGLVASSVFSMWICHRFPPSGVADWFP